MNARFNDRCKLFAHEIKIQSNSWMSENLNYDQLQNLRQQYNWILRRKKQVEFDDDEIHSFCALDKKIQDTVRVSVKKSNNLSNEQYLKLLIAVDVFYLPLDIIHEIIGK